MANPPIHATDGERRLDHSISAVDSRVRRNDIAIEWENDQTRVVQPTAIAAESVPFGELMHIAPSGCRLLPVAAPKRDHDEWSVRRCRVETKSFPPACA